MGKAGLTYSNPMMDYRMKQSLVYVLCSLILAAGFVLGLGRYEVVRINDRMAYRLDRWTGQTYHSYGFLGKGDSMNYYWIPFLESWEDAFPLDE